MHHPVIFGFRQRRDAEKRLRLSSQTCIERKNELAFLDEAAMDGIMHFFGKRPRSK